MKHERKRLGFFDWCILTLAATLLAAGAFVFWRRTGTLPPQVGIECVLRLPPSVESQTVRIGDEVRSENGTITFGKVTNVSERPYKTVFLREGTPVYDAMEGMTETEVTVWMVAEKTSEYSVGDIRVCAGASGAYRIGASYFSGVRVIRLSEVERHA